MLPNQYTQLVETQIAALNPEQRTAIEYGTERPVFVVAGPGSGKTRVLVQRALRHVLVDRILPEHIVITTFTRKAAKEIRSRLIAWGTGLLNAACQQATEEGDEDYLSFLGRVDINRFQTGTLDALCEEALSASRTPAEPRMSLVDEFAAKTMLARRGNLRDVFAAEPAIAAYLAPFMLDGNAPGRVDSYVIDTIKTIADRLIYDRVDLGAIDPTQEPGLTAILGIVADFDRYLADNGLLDFARLEQLILRYLEEGRDIGPLGQAGAILVDEYQDTSLLQEQIYFALAHRNGAALTVVGDDDQALYRFRGATIELFRDFATRATTALGCDGIEHVELTRNYRSSENVVSFFNSFIANDPGFSPDARVQPLKPEISPEAGIEPFPILGIYRDTPEEVAEAATNFLRQVFSSDGYGVEGYGVVRGAEGGAVGDVVLLGKSVNEFSQSFMGQPPRPRFTHFFRNELEAAGFRVFNPRGQRLRDIPAVSQLLGLVMEAIDPSAGAGTQGDLEADIHLTNDVRNVFAQWRAAAHALLDENPVALSGTPLQTRVRQMQDLSQLGASPRDWPVLDAVYAFVPYIPVFSDDPEHQVYLEVISRAAAQMNTFSGYRGMIFRNADHNTRSRASVFHDMIRPLAAGEIAVDEDILPDVPRNCLNMMTIHQAKGLEFPLVMVDVSTAFGTNHRANRFKRFPEGASGTTELEDALSPYTEIGPLRTARSALERSFEDIIREHYVAYSRPESLLVLLGNAKTLRSTTQIKHIGQFWRADESWAWDWGPQGAGRPPSQANIPFIRI